MLSSNKTTIAAQMNRINKVSLTNFVMLPKYCYGIIHTLIKLWTVFSRELVKGYLMKILEIKQEFRGRRHRTCWGKNHRSHNQNVVIK